MHMFVAEKEKVLSCLDTHTGAFKYSPRLRERESSLPDISDGRSLSIQQSVLRMVAAAMPHLRVTVRVEKVPRLLAETLARLERPLPGSRRTALKLMAPFAFSAF
jgi:hypothetical protein